VKAHVLICGASARAAAESAARAGFAVTAIDGYADLDQHAEVRALSMPRDFGRPFTASAAARASRSVDCEAVAYLSSFENHPRAVRTLADGRALWGNPPAVLSRARDPVVVAEALRMHGFAIPMVRLKPDTTTENSPQSNPWMLKPLRSGGGQRVRRWGGGRVPRGHYLQERIDGVTGSVVFVAARRRAVPLGVSRQLIGEAVFGADGYRYCGSLLSAFDDAHVGAACALADAAVAEFDLVGVNGIDFVAAAGATYPIEINPRWSSSMELVERGLGISVFAAHATACMEGTLPHVDSVRAMRDARISGKAIVFARHDIVVGDTTRWLEESDIRDVPHPGERIRRGQPVCTVFAEAVDECACYDALVRRADWVYGQLST
jgi:predicted ATP-grasp superfamily ATP-dependent carboligase